MKVIFAGLFCLLAACGKSANVVSPHDSAFEEVARNPTYFDGRVVTLRGWISMGDEDKNFWSTWKDHETWHTQECISLINYDVLDGSESALDGRYVEITGTVRADASKNGRVIRLASCRDAGIEITTKLSVKRLPTR